MMKNNSWRWRLIGVLLVIAVTVWLVGGVSGVGGSGSQRVVCSGVAEFDLFGLGDIELDPSPQCRFEPCGFLGFSIFSNDGQVKMYVDGRLVDSAGLKTNIIGSNDAFTLSSSCVENVNNVEIILFDENNIQQDRYEVTQ